MSNVTERRGFLKTFCTSLLAGSSVSGRVHPAKREDSLTGQTDFRLENDDIFVELKPDDVRSRLVVSRAGHSDGRDVTGNVETRPRTSSAKPQFDSITRAVSNPGRDQYVIVREYELGEARFEIACTVRLSAGNSSFGVDLTYTNLDDSDLTLDHPGSHIHDGTHVIEGIHLEGRTGDNSDYRFSIPEVGTYSFGDVPMWTTFPGTERAELFDDTDAVTLELQTGTTRPKMWIKENDALDFLTNEVTLPPGQSANYSFLIRIEDRERDTFGTKDYGFTAGGVYVWGPAYDVVTDDEQLAEFFDRMKSLESVGAFFSWDRITTNATIPLPYEKPEIVTGFLDSCEDEGITIHATIDSSGRTELNTAKGRIRRLARWQRNHGGLTGLHLDLEPRDLEEYPEGMTTFLEEYEKILNRYDDHAFQFLSIAIDPWWLDHADLEQFQRVRDHSNVDFVVIFAYADEESRVRDKIETAMKSPDGGYSSQIYMSAVELQSSTENEEVTDEITFWEEGSSAVNEVLSSIESNPPLGETQFAWTVVHDYLALPRYEQGT